MDPAKLKVVELRAELNARGLDSKGNKPVLVKRLREALESETGDDLPDTSVADTSTEELDASNVSMSQSSPERKEPDREVTPEPPIKETLPKSRSRTRKSHDSQPTPEPSTPVGSKKDEKMETTPVIVLERLQEAKEPEVDIPPAEAMEESTKEDEQVKNGEAHETEETEKEVIEEKMEVSESQKDDEDDVDKTETEPEKETEPRSRRSRWGSVVEADMASTDSGDPVLESNDNPVVTAEAEPPTEARGEKRRHESPSPERSQRKRSRSRSPIREDEPEIDADIIQLSWIDSDLNLQVNKDSFTTAEPLHNDGFGFMWAGVRSTHGVKTGKVWYEVKLVENCDWKEAPKKEDRDKEKHRKDQRKERSEDKREEKDKKSVEKDTKESEEKDKSEDSEKDKSEDSEDKCEDSEKDKIEEEVKSSEEKKSDEEIEEEKEKVDEKEKIEVEEKAEGEEKPEEEGKEKTEDEEKTEEEEKVEEVQKEEIPETMHILRVGWSLPNTNLQLGEDKHSYGLDSEGFTVNNSQFTEFEAKFVAGDVVGTFLDMESEPASISYTINGVLQPTAFTVDRSELPEEAAMFAHVLTRNIKFEVNFGQNEEPWFAAPSEMADYKLLKEVEDKVTGLPRPATRQECKVVMMVGLPCSGKSHWVDNHVESNPETNFNVLGLSYILSKMKHRGQARKDLFKGSRTVLIDKCTRCLSKLVEIASLRRRNYILDQTNVFSSAQRRKMRPFEGFRRHAVVIVVADDEQASREKRRQQADGKDVPDSAVLEMKANMSIPTPGDWLDEISFGELDEEKAKEAIQKYNKQGREAGYGPHYTGRQHSNNQKNDKRTYHGRNQKRDTSRDSRNRWGSGSNSGGGGGGGHRSNNWSHNRGPPPRGRHDSRSYHGGGGGGYRSNSNNRMMDRGGYNRNSGRGGRGSDGYHNRDRNPPHRNSGGGSKGGNWGGQGGGNWNNQGGSWGNQSGWDGHQSGQGGGSGTGAWAAGSWNQYGSNQGGGGGGQWKGGYNAQQYQQQYAQGYAGQYGGQYPNWNYYGQYGWNANQGSGGAGDGSNTTQFNQYAQQQQAAWAQYAQGGYGGYGQNATSQGGSTGAAAGATTGAAAIQQTQPATK